MNYFFVLRIIGNNFHNFDEDMEVKDLVFFSITWIVKHSSMNIIKEIKISDNGFVFNSNSGDSFSLNKTGLELIRLISQEMEIEQIKEIFTSRFDVDEFTFEKDFYEFCSLLKLHGILIGENTSEFN